MRDGFHYKFWVYILTSRTGTLYIGITGYIDRRISQHKMDSIEGFTKKYKVHLLVPATRQVSGHGFSRAVQAHKTVFPCCRRLAHSDAERDTKRRG